MWHAGVVNIKNGKLLAFISAIPASIRVNMAEFVLFSLLNYRRILKVVEINFLCVHKKLREKRLAPVLIQEITRRVNLEGIFQAVYTAGSLLPRPVAQCTCVHALSLPCRLPVVALSFFCRCCGA